MTKEVPAYEATIFTPPVCSYSTFVFVLNEGDRIRRQLAKMKPYADLTDIYIADGGSVDGSLDSGYLRECGVRGVLVKTGSGRLSAQMRMALSWAAEKGYKGSICMDGNDKDDPAALPLFLEKLDEGFDHVQGSRYVPGGKALNTPFLRHWGVRVIHAPLLSLAAGFHYTDTTNGFRAYSAAFLDDPRVSPFRGVFQSYELHYYLAIRAARLGYRVCEIPVIRAYPKCDMIPTKIKGLKGNFEILKTLLKACRGDYDPS